MRTLVFVCVAIYILLMTPTPSAFAWGGAGYYGGSSGGIPGTGENSRDRFLAALSERCFYDRHFFLRNRLKCEKGTHRSILPEDRQFPAWNPPYTMMR